MIFFDLFVENVVKYRCMRNMGAFGAQIRMRGWPWWQPKL